MVSVCIGIAQKSSSVQVCLGFAFSVAFTVATTELMKRFAGRPRPNFIAYCGYQFNTSSCTMNVRVVVVFPCYNVNVFIKFIVCGS